MPTTPRSAQDPDPSDSPDDKMRASPQRLRRFAERLAAEGDAEMADQVRRGVDEIDAARDEDAALHGRSEVPRERGA